MSNEKKLLDGTTSSKYMLLYHGKTPTSLLLLGGVIQNWHVWSSCNNCEVLEGG